ncbi:MAG: oxidoreductase [Rhizobiales bacterium PAR1]|nr:MAG: oxidoreductase [Rhizobiales bacterium PAR1]
MKSLLSAVALTVGLIGSATISSAETPAPGKVVLRIEGKLKDGKSVEFSRADLEKLGVSTIRTTTPWYDGVQTFEGVPLAALMHKVGADGRKAQVVALNKYRTEIPFNDFAQYQPILALKRDGQYMDVKDKGPLFIVYPFDAKPELKSEQYYGRSAWQVRTISVE